jgi:hypothetical protein
MTDLGNTPDTAPNTQAMKAEFVRVLSDRIRATSSDPKQTRELVYELARIRLVEQFTYDNARQSRQILRVLENAIRDVERFFERDSPPASSPAVAPMVAPGPPELDARSPPSSVAQGEPMPPRPIALEPVVGASRRAGAFSSMVRLAAILVLVAIVAGAVIYWPRMKTQFAELSQPSSTAAPIEPTPERRESEAAEPPREGQNLAPSQAAQPSMPLPSTFGVYALSDWQLQELKPLSGKIPDRRVAISAAIATPSATTVATGDVKFIVFRPDAAIDASGTEVRVVAKVSRSMGVDATGKAAMVSTGDSWVIRSMSFPYKVAPVEDQPRMLLLQPENDGFTLTPGRYVVVVKGIGYDFTVAGDVTDPNQCVERINAANGAFYSPCPPPSPVRRETARPR